MDRRGKDGELMKDYEAYRIEGKNPGIKGIESDADNLQYFIDDEHIGIVIAGIKGKTGLTIPQAKTLCRELPLILEDMGVAM